WKAIIQPDDIVGIKTNVWAYLPTPREVERAIQRGVRDAEVPATNIGIGDRNVLRQRIFRRTTALINSRPMRTHAWSGVGSLIKNYIMFVNRPPGLPSQRLRRPGEAVAAPDRQRQDSAERAGNADTPVP
ncbi:MAG: hypothetical protein GTO05_12470, partial [Gemmatimonadales bacterium]|nr:hypothetical protein [Gemmatimonadales bacterium]